MTAGWAKQRGEKRPAGKPAPAAAAAAAGGEGGAGGVGPAAAAARAGADRRTLARVAPAWM